MVVVVLVLALLTLVTLFPPPATSSGIPFPPATTTLCPQSREPTLLARPLNFCSDIVVGLTCCDDAQDEALKQEFYGIGDAPMCASMLKGFICSTCIPSPLPRAFNNMSGALLTQLCDSAQPSSSSASTHYHGRTLCVEKIGEGAFHGAKAHPDGSERIFLWNQDGRVWLSSMPKTGSGGRTLRTSDDNLIVDVRVLGLEFCGLVDVAASLLNKDGNSPRMFITYYRRRWAAGASPSTCGCSTAAAKYCQLVVAELRLLPRSGGHHSMATPRVDPSRFVTIYSMQLQQPRFASSHCRQQQGGQMLLPRNDNHLYLVTGNGNVLRFDVGHMPAAGALMPEVLVAAGGGFTPMGCGLDYEDSILLCAVVDEDLNEQVSTVSYDHSNSSSSGPAAVVATPIISHGRRSAVPSIAGGVYCDIPTDTSSKKTRFLYAYKSHPWIAEEITKGQYTAVEIAKVTCSTKSPLPCDAGGVFRDRSCLYFGTDNNKDAVILDTNAVLRVVSHGHCAAPATDADGDGYLWQVLTLGFALVFAFALVYFTVFAPGGEGRNTCCSSVTTNNTTTEINNNGNSIELPIINNPV